MLVEALEALLGLQIGVQRELVRAVDVGLLHPREGGVEVDGAEFVDLVVRSRSLSAELIAGDVQDFQTFVVVILVKFLDRGILWSEAAPGRRVHDQDDFALVIGETQRFAFAGRERVIVDHRLFSFSVRGGRDDSRNRGNVSRRKKADRLAVRLTNTVLLPDLFRFPVFGDRVREGDDALRERDIEAGGFDRLLQFALDLPEGGPVIAGGDPEAERQVDRAVGEFVHEDLRSGILEDQFVLFHQLLQNADPFGEGIAVGDADRDIDAAGGVAGVILDRAAEDGAVRSGDEDPVGGGEGGGEEAHLLDGTADRAAVDVVADLIGPEQEEHQTGGDVAEGVLHGEADGQAGGAEHGQQAGGVEAEEVEDDQHGEEPQEGPRDGVEDLSDGSVERGDLLHGAFDHFADEAPDQQRDQDDDQCEQQDFGEMQDRILMGHPEILECAGDVPLLHGVDELIHCVSRLGGGTSISHSKPPFGFTGFPIGEI